MPEHIARLYRVEPELLAFAKALRDSEEWRAMRDGDALVRRFESAGFGDFFYAPTPSEWRELHARKLPDLSAALTRSLALDTLYSLLVDADFENHQAEIDLKIARILGDGGDTGAGAAQT